MNNLHSRICYKVLKKFILQALVEQVTYGPFAMVSFFFGMSLLEGKSVETAKDQVEAKFWPTFQVKLNHNKNILMPFHV